MRATRSFLKGCTLDRINLDTSKLLPLLFGTIIFFLLVFIIVHVYVIGSVNLFSYEVSCYLKILCAWTQLATETCYLCMVVAWISSQIPFFKEHFTYDTDIS